jgi:hypothetical protein
MWDQSSFLASSSGRPAKEITKDSLESAVILVVAVEAAAEATIDNAPFSVDDSLAFYSCIYK